MNTHVAILPAALMPELRDRAAQALFIRRHELGLSQEDVANAAGIISQRTVSELERGKYLPDKLTAGRAAALARALKWTLFDLQQATGVDFGVTDEPPPASSLPTFPIPDALAEAAKKYGGEFARPLWQKHLAELYFRSDRPETPDDWYFLYRSLSQLGLGPKGDN